MKRINDEKIYILKDGEIYWFHGKTVLNHLGYKDYNYIIRTFISANNKMQKIKLDKSKKFPLRIHGKSFFINQFGLEQIPRYKKNSFIYVARLKGENIYKIGRLHH